MPIIQALDRALNIIELFDEQTKELKITEISSRMKLHKSTVHSLLKTLQLHGYIDQDEQTGKYRLGMKLVEKGQLLLQGIDIRGLARPHLQALSAATGQTAHLVVLEGSEGIYIDKVEGAKAAIRYSRIGRRVSLHSSAVGKVLAAFRSEQERSRLLMDYRFEKRTGHTIDSLGLFLTELARVRQEGIAYDREENEPGVRCVASPIYDYSGQVIAAMSISTMVSQVDEAELQRLAQLLRSETGSISRELGYRG
ncbi:IclR family transcriptional regulator [Paenibacillus abyssi]|uniref:Glycerol operon regulatory protein n=1 Tax=Paenibacillus abyssi TaxID=1340531 RepID=A0A917G4P2_9BACL|nr:IclR family transcriptional regulator [Paenibacillus abyssi]GGG22832.1 putative HTH-type transcriptional regulator YagI [Paenibacillus abyssi]